MIVSLGTCIRNNAATNIFNKDLDSRNYGVGRYGRVFLFDYDAVEKLTDVKIRTNADREPGEEAVPDWFFEDGVIFLPEELEHGMQLAQPLRAALLSRGERRSADASSIGRTCSRSCCAARSRNCGCIPTSCKLADAAGSAAAAAAPRGEPHGYRLRRERLSGARSADRARMRRRGPHRRSRRAACRRAPARRARRCAGRSRGPTLRVVKPWLNSRAMFSAAMPTPLSMTADAHAALARPRCAG